MRCLMGQATMGLRPCELIYESIDKQRISPGWLEEQYEKHNAYVRAKVPKEAGWKIWQGSFILLDGNVIQNVPQNPCHIVLYIMV